MPTNPIKEFIPREIESPQLKAVLSQFSAFIDETINFGSHVFKWGIENIKGGDENIPVFLTYRHIFELLDSISVLIKESCVEPCKSILRALFESFLTFEYILEKDTEQRGRDYLIWCRHRELKYYRRHDPTDILYKEYNSKIKKDKLLKNMKRLIIPDIKAQIDSLNIIFSLPSYADSEKEYQRMRNPKWWFNMHKGPNDIQTLATYLGYAAFYDILYRFWSDFLHGTDIMRGKFSIDKPGEVAFTQLRLPTEAQFVTLMSVSFALSVIRNLINHYVKSRKQEMRIWYLKEIRDKYLELAKMNRIEVR
ncbi:MAG: DUF5677 domain-containing protein [Acidobacteriota bacterium]|nr:DUF5677 domain-containing protein [Acidobacteriota bacterium]